MVVLNPNCMRRASRGGLQGRVDASATMLSTGASELVRLEILAEPDVVAVAVEPSSRVFDLSAGQPPVDHPSDVPPGAAASQSTSAR